jgi:quinoprotein glucose dehydrogenase
VWHYQLVNHDVWNYDTSHAPQLLDITVEGRRIMVAAVNDLRRNTAYIQSRIGI